VDLVRDDPHVSGCRQRRDRREFVNAVHGAGGVVRVAQQVRGPVAVNGRAGKHLAQRVQVETVQRGQWRLHDPPTHVLDERVERRVHGAVDHDSIAGLGDQPQHLDHAHHHVGHDRCAFHRDTLPAPPVTSEARKCFGIRGASRVTGVAQFDGVDK
jgi:hypothetical protein